MPPGDPSFDPNSTGTQVIGFNRSELDPATGTGPGNPRQQINDITAFLDGSMIYGSNPVVAEALRTGQGGRLKTSPGADGVSGTMDDLLPLNNQTTSPASTRTVTPATRRPSSSPTTPTSSPTTSSSWPATSGSTRTSS